MSEQVRPVTAYEVNSVLRQLRELAERSRDNRQQMFHFVLGTCAESLEDNMAALADMESDNHG